MSVRRRSLGLLTASVLLASPVPEAIEALLDEAA